MRLNKKNCIINLLLIIILTSIFPVYGKTYNQGVVIVIDGNKPSMKRFKNKVKEIILKTRQENKRWVKGKNPLIKIYDVKIDSHRPFIYKVLNLSPGSLPFVGLAKLRHGGSFWEFEKGCTQKNATNPIKSAQLVMKRFYQYLPPYQKRHYKWNLKTGIKSLLTAPPGASVYINNKFIGKTDEPLKNIRLSPGKHSLRIEMPQYQTYEENLLIPYGSFMTLSKQIQWHTGSLKFITNPPGAYTIIDGKGYGKSPVNIMAIPPGYHNVKVSLIGFLPLNKKIFIKGNKDGRIITKECVTLKLFNIRYLLNVESNSYLYESSPGSNKFLVKYLAIDSRKLRKDIKNILARAPVAFIKTPDKAKAKIQINLKINPQKDMFTYIIELKLLPSKKIFFQKEYVEKSIGQSNRRMQDRICEIFKEALIGKDTKDYNSPEIIYKDCIIKALYNQF